jgi:hypothetical protein
VLLLQAVIVGNAVWALVAAGLMVALAPGAPGLLFLALHLAPALFAVLQRAGLKRSTRAGPSLRVAAG